MSKAFVGFSKGRAAFSYFIMWAQLGRYSHAFFAMEYQGKWFVIDSTRTGIKIRKMEDFSHHARIVKKFEIDSSEDHARKIFNMCVERSYDNYPFAEILGNLLQLVVKWGTFGKIRIRNIFREGERSPRCQELVAIILRDIYGHEIGENLDDTDLLWLDEYLERKYGQGR